MCRISVTNPALPRCPKDSRSKLNALLNMSLRRPREIFSATRPTNISFEIKKKWRTTVENTSKSTITAIVANGSRGTKLLTQG